MTLQAQKARKISDAQKLMSKAASDPKVQKVIGKKKPPGKGRGRKSIPDPTDGGKSGNEDKNAEVEGTERDDNPKEDDTTPKKHDADGDLKTRWEACEPWNKFRSHNFRSLIAVFLKVNCNYCEGINFIKMAGSRHNKATKEEELKEAGVPTPPGAGSKKSYTLKGVGENASSLGILLGAPILLCVPLLSPMFWKV